MLKWVVLMSLSSTPALSSSAVTAAMAVAAWLCATATVSACASTPRLSRAMSGTTVTVPSPLTQIPVLCWLISTLPLTDGLSVSQPVTPASITASNPILTVNRFHLI